MRRGGAGRPTGASAPSILRAPARGTRALSLKGKKWWVHAAEGIHSDVQSRITLARISDAIATRVLAAPLAGPGDKVTGTVMAEEPEVGRADPRHAPEPPPRRVINEQTITKWYPRRAGASVLVERVTVKEAPHPRDPARRVVTVLGRGSMGLRFSIPRNRPACPLKDADALMFVVAHAGKIAAVNFRIPVERRSFHALAWQPFILEAAWNRVRRGGPGTGIDRISWRAIKDPRRFVELAAARLRSGRVAPKPLKQVYIPKADRVRWRTLAIPTLRDRLIQAAIVEVLGPLYEERFLDCSYGFRPRRSSTLAIKRLREWLDAGYRWIVAIDLQDFFEEIPWPVLKKFLKEDIPDRRLIKWIMMHVSVQVRPAPFPATGDTSNLAPPPPDGSLIVRTKGVPQGSPLSPLMANLYLHRFDQWVTQNRYRMIRYADDITFIAKRRADADRLLADSTFFLETRLGLPVNRAKSHVYDANRPEPVPTLGFEITKGGIYPSQRNIERCKEMLLAILEQPWPERKRREAFSLTTTGWGRYFAATGGSRILDELERWAVETLRGFDAGAAGRAAAAAGGEEGEEELPVGAFGPEGMAGD